MLKTAFEAATLIGVAVAIIAGSYYALGTVAYFSRLDDLGFDAHQFPSAGLELHLTGFWSSLTPALYIILAVANAIAVIKLADPHVQKLDQRLRERWPTTKRRVGVVMVAGAGAAAGCLVLYALGSFPGAKLLVLLPAVLLPGLVLVPRLLVAVLAALFVLIVSSFMIVQVGADARKKAADWREKIKPASTIIEFNDGRKITAPGARVVCSEHFCGFHDGKTATVISLEGVRSIQSPGAEEHPSPPAAERRGLW